jgi:hypothetical protein
MAGYPNVLPTMTLQGEYEAIAALLVRRGWRRERHWFYPPTGAGGPMPLREAVGAELTAAYCREKRGRR